MTTLIETYNSAIKRIHANKYAVVLKSKFKDIDRILYIRELEAKYDSDTIYGLFVGMSAERINSIRKALTAEKWHLLPEEERYVFLNKNLLDEQYAEYYDLFADFRNSGYRILGFRHRCRTFLRELLGIFLNKLPHHRLSLIR